LARCPSKSAARAPPSAPASILTALLDSFRGCTCPPAASICIRRYLISSSYCSWQAGGNTRDDACTRSGHWLEREEAAHAAHTRVQAAGARKAPYPRLDGLVLLLDLVERGAHHRHFLQLVFDCQAGEGACGGQEGGGIEGGRKDLCCQRQASCRLHGLLRSGGFAVDPPQGDEARQEYFAAHAGLGMLAPPGDRGLSRWGPEGGRGGGDAWAGAARFRS